MHSELKVVYINYCFDDFAVKAACVYLQMVRRERVSNACDVYSYGVLLFEIIEHEIPTVNMGKIYAGKVEVGYTSLIIHD